MENPASEGRVSMRVWNLTDHDIMITWPGCGARKPNEGYDPTSCGDGERLVRHLCSFLRGRNSAAN